MPDKKVWFASMGTPGYVRDESCACATKATASMIAKEWADQFRDDIDEDCRPAYRVYGNMRDGYEIERRANPELSLNLVITVESCYLNETEAANWEEYQDGELY